MENMENINIVISQLDDFLKEQKTKISKIFIDEKTADGLFIENDFAIKEFLIKIFGKEKDVSDKGLFSQLIDYNNADNYYSDSVIFSFWTYRGESDIYLKENTGKWRKNFYYKGHRWSSDILKSQFYHFFEYFERISNGNTPIEFFTFWGLKSKKTFFRVSLMENKPNTLTVPDIRKLNLHEVNNYISLIDRYRSIIVNEKTTFNQTSNSDEIYMYEHFKDVYIKAKEQLQELSIVKEFKEQIDSFFGCHDSSDNCYDVISEIILTLFYFDQPYDINFFLPKDHSEKSCLVITTKQNKIIEDEIIKILVSLVDALRYLSKLDREIWDKLKSNIVLFWSFKDAYSNQVCKYEQLSDTLLNLFRTIAREKNIEFIEDKFRIKDFNSFMHKVIKIANEGIINPDSLTEKEKKRSEVFIDVLKEENPKRIIELFELLSDISGIRIVCLFDSEAVQILEVLDEINKDIINGIQIIDKDDYTQSKQNKSNEFDYRSYHRVIKLRPGREAIYEFKGLSNIHCELQVRTMLSDMWANTSHKLIYKQKLPSQLLKESKIENELFSLSGHLGSGDERFDRLLETFKQLMEKTKSCNIS